MKKRIQTMIILAALLLSTATGCQNGADNLPESNLTDSNGNYQEPTNIATYDQPRENNSYLNDYSVIYGNDGECYVYIKAWDTYRKITIPYLLYGYGPCFDPTSAVINEESAIMALYDYDNQSANVTVYHFNKNNEDVKSYTAELKSKFYTRLLEAVFVNIIDENTVCFFGLTKPTHETGDQEPSFIKVVTEDGGETWNSEEILFSNVTIENDLTIAKFVSNKIGIISYAYFASEEDNSGKLNSNWDDIFDGTYITTDGGLSWNRISLEYDSTFGGHNYSYENIISSANIINFSTYGSDKNTYKLSFCINNRLTGYFISENFIDWELPKGK